MSVPIFTNLFSGLQSIHKSSISGYVLLNICWNDTNANLSNEFCNWMYIGLPHSKAKNWSNTIPLKVLIKVIPYKW